MNIRLVVGTLRFRVLSSSGKGKKEMEIEYTTGYQLWLGVDLISTISSRG